MRLCMRLGSFGRRRREDESNTRRGGKRRDDALSRLIDSFPSNMKTQQNK
jgi:hypothetical protein